MELHAIHETPTVTSQTNTLLRPPEMLESNIMRALSMEMEDVIVENKLKSEVGPVKTAWDAAIEKGRRKGAEDWRLREIADKLPSPPPETCRMKIHNRARSLSM